MSPDEKVIIDYLKSCHGAFVSAREISRRAGDRRRYEKDNSWSKRVLHGMVSKGLVETDPGGHFRIPPEEESKKKKALRRHLSPHMRRLLEASGQNFDGVAIDEDGGA